MPSEEPTNERIPVPLPTPLQIDPGLIPDNSAAERIVVGALLCGIDERFVPQSAVLGILESLDPDDFDSGQLRAIWKTLQEMAQDFQVVTLETLYAQAEASGRDGELDRFDLASNLYFDYRDEVIALPTHIQNLQRRNLTRKIMTATAVGAFDRVKDLVGEMETLGTERRLRTHSENIEDYLAKLKAGPVDKIRLGFPELDDLLGGLGAGNLMTIGARPGVGKSSLAITILYNLSIRPHPEYATAVGFVTLEMGVEEIYGRLASLQSGKSTQITSVRKFADEATVAKIEGSIVNRSTAPVTVERSGGTLPDVVRLIRKMVEERSVQVVIVDYLQLITVVGPSRSEPRHQHIAHITRTLKAVAQELGIPIITLAQLRRPTAGEHVEPQLGELKDGGSQEQDADQVLFLYQSAEDAKESVKGATALTGVVKKNRHGPTGRSKLVLQKTVARIAEAEVLTWEAGSE